MAADEVLGGILAGEQAFRRIDLDPRMGVLVRPLVGMSDLESIQAALDRGAAIGLFDVKLPPRDPTDITVEWEIDDEITISMPFRIDGRAARITQTVANKPCFLIRPEAAGAKIELGKVTGVNPRPVYADYVATGPGGIDGTFRGTRWASQTSAVYCSASNCTITLHDVSYFYAAINLNAWDGVEGANNLNGPRWGNRIYARCTAEVDFGLVYHQQYDLDFTMYGTYTLTSGDPNPSHLVYGARQADGGGADHRNVTGRGSAWDGVGGPAFQFKGHQSLSIDRLYTDGCQGTISLVDNAGAVEVAALLAVDDTVAGSACIFHGDTIGPFPNATKKYGTVKITQSTQADGTDDGSSGRCVTVNHDTTFDSLDIEQTIDAATTSLVAVHAKEDNLRIGQFRLVNHGLGGMRGIRYAAGTKGHVLLNPPEMRGVTYALAVQTGVTGVRGEIDPALITFPTGFAGPRHISADDSNVLDLNPNLGVRQARPRLARASDWYSHSESTEGSSVTAQPSRNTILYLHAELLGTGLAAWAINVLAAGNASSAYRLALHSDYHDQVGALISDLGSVSAASVGVKTATLASVLTLPYGPGWYWLAIAFIGTAGTAPIVQGVTAIGGKQGRNTAARVFTGSSRQVSFTDGTVDAFPTNPVTVSDDLLTVPRVALQAAYPIGVGP